MIFRQPKIYIFIRRHCQRAFVIYPTIQYPSHTDPDLHHAVAVHPKSHYLLVRPLGLTAGEMYRVGAIYIKTPLTPPSPLVLFPGSCDPSIRLDSEKVRRRAPAPLFPRAPGCQYTGRGQQSAPRPLLPWGAPRAKRDHPSTLRGLPSSGNGGNQQSPRPLVPVVGPWA